MPRILLTAFAALIMLCQPAAAQTGPAPRFLHISDVHLDPFADPGLVPALIAAPANKWDRILAKSKTAGFPAKHKDSNYALFRSALTAAAANGPYDYVIFTGDYLAHDFQVGFQAAGGQMKDYAGFAAKTLVFVNNSLRAAFRAPILAAVGNNDSDCGDYNLRPNSPMLAAMGASLPLVAADPQALKDLSATGSYKVPHPAIAGRDVIALDDVPLVPAATKQWAAQNWASTTNNFPCATPPSPIDPIGWLTSALDSARAAKRTVTLILHIPPGVDNYNASRQPCPNGAPLMLDTSANAQLVGLLRGYRDVIHDVYAGHTHMDDFRVLLDGAGAGVLPVRIGPSVSPYFGNVPSFAAFDYDRAKGNAFDYAVRTVQPAAAGPAKSSWPLEYRFTSAYGLGDWGAAGLGALAGKIRSDAAVRTIFGNFYESSPALNPLTPPGANWLAYACAETALLPGDYSACTCPAPAGS
jgi:sphingomyelin phosphodiesterase acid-like 3